MSAEIKIFCRCVTCGASARVTNKNPVPKDWVAFLAAHWPADSDPGPLFLRMCGTCKGRLDREGVILDVDRGAAVRLTPLPRPAKGYRRAYKKCRECGAVMYYDYVPYSLSRPILTTTCGHGITERDYGLDDISRTEFYARRAQAPAKGAAK